MRFLKQHYEKILLGLALFGVVGAVAAMFVMVAKEKDDLQSLRDSLIKKPVKELAFPAEFGSDTAFIDSFPQVHQLDFSSKNKLFNPVLWVKASDGKPMELPDPVDLLRQLQVTNATPLYFELTLTKVDATDSGIAYGIMVDHQAEGGKRGPYFVAMGQRKDYTMAGGKKYSFTIVSTNNGTVDEPKLTLQLNDSNDRITLTKESPHKEVEGYMIDLRLDSIKLNRTHLHVGSSLAINGDDYTIAAITQNEVTLSAKSNNKKTTIQYNAEP